MPLVGGLGHIAVDEFSTSLADRSCPVLFYFLTHFHSGELDHCLAEI
jgi:hypothetical protein